MTPYQSIKAHNLRNPEKVKAKHKVFIEVRAGRIVKQPCEICGDKHITKIIQNH